MKFSVAMCTYDGARYVREQLESIANQTRPPDELVVCDDGSVDQTADIVAAFARTASFPVRLQVNEANLGSTKNFEQAVTMCDADLIAFSDQDDVWMPEKLRHLERVLESGSCLAFTNGDVVDETLKPLGWTVWDMLRFGEREQKRFQAGEAFDVLLDHNVVTGAAMAFRASFRDLILPIPEGLKHDGIAVLHDWWTALMITAVADAAFIEEPLFKYRQHERQQMGVRTAIKSEADGTPSGEASVIDALRRRNSFADEIHYLRTIAARLRVARHSLRDRAVLAGVRAKLAHLEARAAMPESLLRRLPSVVRELLTLRYHAHSHGIYSAAKDLWLGNGSA